MSKKREVDAQAGKVAAGLAVVVASVVGFGWWRRRVARAHGGPCKVVEESVYRGFEYRIETCPAGPEGQVYFGVVPAQQVGSIRIEADEGDFLGSLEGARRYVQSRIDNRLAPQLQAVFVGANR